MLRLPRSVEASPAPIRAVVELVSGAAFLAVMCWPLWYLAVPKGSVVIGLAAGVTGQVVLRRQLRRDTGWPVARRAEMLDRLRRGEVPADPGDRDRLRVILRTAAQNDRGADWIILALCLIGAVLPPLNASRYPGYLEWVGAGWLAAAGILAFTLTRRRQAHCHRQLTLLDAAEASPGTGSSTKLP